MENSEMAELADELIPYTAEYLINLVTVLEDDDLKRMGKWSNETLSEKYQKNKEYLKSAEPKKDYSKDPVKERSFKLVEPIIDQINDQGHHSNNWVIHGNHTLTGLPMLANDPHLGSSLPSFWQLMEIYWPGEFLIGASLPGVPLIGIGRSKNVSWGQTAPLCDSSDLWQEEISADKTQYKVDGKWMNLKISTETIKIKGADGNVKSIDFDISLSHRGVLIQPELIYNADVLFGSAMPEARFNNFYSLAWGGQFPGETFI